MAATKCTDEMALELAEADLSLEPLESVVAPMLIVIVHYSNGTTVVYIFP